MDEWQERFAQSAFGRNSDLAHDLKTPLNVSVLNLELLRMRLVKLIDGPEDPKAWGYIKAVEVELRRMAKIFDAFFVYSTPPRDGSIVETIEVAPLFVEAFWNVGLEIVPGTSAGHVVAHPTRLRELFRLLATAATKIFAPGTLVISEQAHDGRFLARVSGEVPPDEIDIGKIFKFYYTDASGAPDLSLATARLIAETYGGELEFQYEAPRARIELSLPLGE